MHTVWVFNAVASLVSLRILRANAIKRCIGFGNTGGKQARAMSHMRNGLFIPVLKSVYLSKSCRILLGWLWQSAFETYWSVESVTFHFLADTWLGCVPSRSQAGVRQPKKALIVLAFLIPEIQGRNFPACTRSNGQVQPTKMTNYAVDVVFRTGMC